MAENFKKLGANEVDFSNLVSENIIVQAPSNEDAIEVSATTDLLVGRALVNINNDNNSRTGLRVYSNNASSSVEELIQFGISNVSSQQQVIEVAQKGEGAVIQTDNDNIGQTFLNYHDVTNKDWSAPAGGGGSIWHSINVRSEDGNDYTQSGNLIKFDLNEISSGGGSYDVTGNFFHISNLLSGASSVQTLVVTDGTDGTADTDFAVLYDINGDKAGVLIDSEANDTQRYALQTKTGQGAVSFRAQATGSTYAELARPETSSVGSHILHRNLTSSSTNGPVVLIRQDHASDDQATLRFQQDGSGNIIETTSGVFTVDSAGKLGAGIGSPVSVIHAYQNDSEIGSGAGVTIEQDGTGDALMQFIITGIRRWVFGIDNSDLDKFKISSTVGVGISPLLTMDVSGNLGIGTSSPERKLHVAGDIRVTGLPTSDAGLSAGDLWDDGGTVKVV